MNHVIRSGRRAPLLALVAASLSIGSYSANMHEASASSPSMSSIRVDTDFLRVVAEGSCNPEPGETITTVYVEIVDPTGAPYLEGSGIIFPDGGYQVDLPLPPDALVGTWQSNVRCESSTGSYRAPGLDFNVEPFDPTMTSITPDLVARGRPVTVDGKCFAAANYPARQVTVNLYSTATPTSEAWGRAVPNADGSYSIRVILPNTAAPGEWRSFLTCSYDGGFTQTILGLSFTVTNPRP